MKYCEELLLNLVVIFQKKKKSKRWTSILIKSFLIYFCQQSEKTCIWAEKPVNNEWNTELASNVSYSTKYSTLGGRRHRRTLTEVTRSVSFLVVCLSLFIFLQKWVISKMKFIYTAR